MDIAPISSQLQAMVAQIHEQTHSKKADAYLLCEAALQQAREIRDDAAFIAVAINYALVIDQQGYPDRCINILYEALQLAQSYHLFKEEGRLLIVIGRSLYTRAEYQLAIQAWAQALEVSELAHDHSTWVWAKFGVAQIYDALEDHRTAIILLKQAKIRAEQLQDPPLLMHVILNLGVNLYRLKQYIPARECYQTAILLAEQIQYRDEIGELHFRISEVDIAEGKINDAIIALDKAESICTATHHLWALANIHMTRAAIFELQLNITTAYAELKKGIADAIQSGSNHILMRLYFAQSNLAEKENNFALCLNAFKLAIQIQQQIFPSHSEQQLRDLEDIAGLRPSPGRILLELSNHKLLNKPQLITLARLICQQSLHVLKVHQASYWLYQAKENKFKKIIRHTENSENLEAEYINSKEFTPFCDGLLNDETIIAHSIKNHQQTWQLNAQYFLPSHIFAAIITPIKVNAEVRGFLCFEHCQQQRNWSSSDVQYANQLAIIAARGISNIDLSDFVNQIAQLNSELVKNNDELEARVKKRTVELSSAMEHLIQSEKLASLGNLVAGFAHELNTPLGNTLTAASTLLEKNKELIAQSQAGKMKKSILDQYIDDTTMIAQLVERNARKASNLISNLKQVAVDTASSKQRLFNLAKIVEETLITLGPSLRQTLVTIDVDIPQEIELNSYPGSLEQIVTNLINNAIIHAFPARNQSGRISIKAQALDKEHIQIFFEDNGIGISESIKSKIFDPFFTTKFGQGGSGLGLYLVYSLVTGTLGGQLQLDSREGFGCQFILTIPIHAPAEQSLSFDPHRH